ncbi:dihydroorotate dehydrogenase [Desulforegula conservatrix]|uniref:dihydroorotate dehydrogenase n=1 Tax=Desulforegula conservatrix TaxID=153026 RepID=UPI00041F8CC1|nr:dihydroorotate dehydrogenase [Desulforegula conservatrix]
MNTNIRIGSIDLKNPVISASGTYGYAREYGEALDINALGAIVVKGISIEPSKGNPEPRIAETPCGMLNSIGLENVGIKAFISKKLPYLKSLETPVITNIYGKTADEYAELAGIIDKLDGISGIEVNISCPNVSKGGVAFGTVPELTHEVISAVRKQTSKTLIAKLSPNVTDITIIARAAEAAGADALSLINTITGMAIDIRTRKPMLANITGGLSGPAIKPVAVRMVWQTANSVSIPVIGLGGITCAEDAIEFIIAGATAVQIGTANFPDPKTPLRIIEGIVKYMKKNKITSLHELRGTVKI